MAEESEQQLDLTQERQSRHGRGLSADRRVHPLSASLCTSQASAGPLLELLLHCSCMLKSPERLRSCMPKCH